MKITYDDIVDAVYIKLIDGDHQCRTIRLNDDIALKIGKNESLVGIEILDAKEVLADGNFPTVLLDNINYELVV